MYFINKSRPTLKIASATDIIKELCRCDQQVLSCDNNQLTELNVMYKIFVRKNRPTVPNSIGQLHKFAVRMHSIL